MGLLVDGVWQDRCYDTEKCGGGFIQRIVCREVADRNDRIPHPPAFFRLPAGQ